MSEAKLLGASWVRAALQVNPYAYKGAVSPSNFFPDEASYNASLVDACVTAGIALIGITDHWCVDSSEGLIEAASRSGITVLPGFEANTSEGIHLLVLFEAETSLSEVNAAIGNCGEDITPGCPSGTAGDSYDNIMAAMTKRGALVIPAHANVSPRGMLTVLTGAPLVKMVKHANLHAIGITPGVADGTDQESIFAARKPYDRPHKLAQLHADDVCRPERLTEPGGSCWLKMSSVGLAGVKHAVRTHETRVSLTDPTSRPRALLRSMTWIGGFMDGAEVTFAEDLTTLVGGRGTGKSTVIESLRFVLDVEPIGEGAQRDHRLVVKHVIETGSIVELHVDAVSPVAGRYTIRRTVDDPPVVLDASGSVTALKPADVVGQIEIFGQHELAEVAQQPAYVAEMITRFSSEVQPVDLPAIQAALHDNRRRLGATEAEQTQLEDELSDMGRLEATVEQFAKAEWPKRLGEQQQMNRDEAIIGVAESRIGNLERAVQELADSDLGAALRAELEGLAESPDAETLRDIEGALEELATTAEQSVASLLGAVTTAQQRVAAVRATWVEASEPKREAHAEIVRQLKGEGHDPDRLLATQNRLTKLKARATHRETLKQKQTKLLEERKRLLGELQGAETAIRKHLGRAVKKANEATAGSVLVKPIASPDRDALVEVINRHVQNSRKALVDLTQTESFSPRDFVAAARAGELESKYNLKGQQLAAIQAAGEPFLREFEESLVDRAVEVFLNVGEEDGPKQFKALESLSKGQRATALLLLLLGAAESPLIIDQPEDDLDNRFVYNGVVKSLRSLKGTRQIIVSTHNANVPVLGDAELVVTLEGDGQRGWVSLECTGSLDDEAVRRTAEDILEGGHTAFDTRRHLYGF